LSGCSDININFYSKESDEAITKGNLKKEDKVLILAGSGGVGTLAIQIAKHVGAYVATTTTAKNADLVKRLGADLVIDYKTEKFQERLADYDLVFDMLGGDSIVESFKVLKKGGALVSIKGEDTENLAPQYGVRFENFFMSPDGKMLTELVGLLDTKNLITAMISTRMPTPATNTKC